MKQKLLLFIFLFTGIYAFSQTNWTYAGGNGSTGAEVSKAICTDAAGNIYVTGNFSNTVDLDYGGGTANVTSSGSNDIFIASYTATGAYRWSLRAGNTGNDNGIAIVTNGTDVYATGFYTTSATFGGTTLNSLGLSDGYLVKLNATTGAVTWAVNCSGTGSDTPLGLCLDTSNNIYLAASYSATWTGCPSPTSSGSSDIVIQKMSPVAGACVWTVSGGSTSGDGGTGTGICYIATGNKIVVTTAFSGPSATFGTFTLTNSGSTVQNDLAILELDAATGVFTNAITFGVAGTNDDGGACVYDQNTGSVFVTGSYQGSLVLPNGGAGITLTSAGGNDIWIGRYSLTTHNFVWAKSAGGTTGDINQEKAFAITNDGSGTIAISGSHLSNPTNFGSLSLSNTSGFGQIFIAGYNAVNGNELWVNNATTAAPALQSTGRGITTYPNSGVFWVTGTFCTTTTFGTQPSITSTGFADLFNAKFTAPVLGNIAFDINSNLKIYPNPTTDVINIDFQDLKNASVEVLDVNGRQLFVQKLNNTSNTISVANLASGVYLFRVSSNEGNSITKVVKY